MKQLSSNHDPKKISLEALADEPVPTEALNRLQPAFRRISVTGLAMAGGSGALCLIELWLVGIPIGLAALWILWRHGRPIDEL